MNRREGAIVSAFTGILAGSFSDLHEYAEELFGRPMLTHEFGSKEISKKLKELSRKDFIAMAEATARLAEESQEDNG